MISIHDDHGPRLLRIDPARVRAAMADELVENAKVIAADAAFSIIDGAVSGSAHVPSSPGNPPNADTHDLDQSIHVGDVVEIDGKIQTSVIADSDHALYMEKGTSRVAERPFLEPASVRQHQAVPKGLADTFNKLART